MVVGDKVICIDNSSKYFVEAQLTNGKVYTIIGNSITFISIINDYGFLRRYEPKRFKLLSEYRKETIEEILNE